MQTLCINITFKDAVPIITTFITGGFIFFGYFLQVHLNRQTKWIDDIRTNMASLISSILSELDKAEKHHVDTGNKGWLNPTEITKLATQVQFFLDVKYPLQAQLFDAINDVTKLMFSQTQSDLITAQLNHVKNMGVFVINEQNERLNTFILFRFLKKPKPSINYRVTNS